MNHTNNRPGIECGPLHCGRKEGEFQRKPPAEAGGRLMEGDYPFVPLYGAVFDAGWR